MEFKSRADEIFRQHEGSIHVRTDRLFAKLFYIEYIAGIVIAVLSSPLTFSGSQSSVHPNVWAAIFLGALLFSWPLLLVYLRPGQVITRHSIAIAQTLFSALLIHITGGRIETHFHIFGSLAF